MINHTNSYLVLRRNAQEAINFAVLSCHAVPALNAYMKAVEGGTAPKLPDPDYFGVVQAHDKLRAFKPSYKKTLGRFVLLSSFSYFEAYVQDAIREVIDFHGDWKGGLREKNLRSMNTNDPMISKARRGLTERRKAGPEQRYAKLQATLREAGYRFPSDLVAAFGIAKVEEALQDLRAARIPEFLQSAFGFDMPADDLLEFQRLREWRNTVAHGRGAEVDLGEAMTANRFLRGLAMRIDSHLVRNFLVIEPAD
ncbi:MAG: hypothetical protein H6742_14255 [Alphaproteobacteria bacterium]|nr:hypothetical protein [Alphaproteobacteria bacterium]